MEQPAISGGSEPELAYYPAGIVGFLFRIPHSALRIWSKFPVEPICDM